MSMKPRKAFLAATGLGVALALTFVGAHAQPGAVQASGGQMAGMQGMQAAPAGTPAKKASEVYKNIQVLKDIDADQLVPSMQFISAALGVDCEFCHVQGGRDKDDKQEKLTARKMILMTQEINKSNFNGRLQVTCYSCHRGSNDPVSTPVIPDVEAPRMMPGPGGMPGGAPAAAAMPTVDQIADKYLQAVGGADAVAKITSRVEKGNTVAYGQTTPVELDMKAPDKLISITHRQNGDNVTAFDGTKGWTGSPTRPRDMDATATAAEKVDAVFSLAAELKQTFPRLRAGRPEKIGDKEMYVLISQGPPPVRLYFDEQTGLLVRMIRYTETPLGRIPMQIDYSDYRDTDGVKVPFRWTQARTNGRSTTQIDSVQQNVPIDDSKFAEPAASTGGGRGQ